MPDSHEPDLGPHPQISQEPIRTGNPPETLEDREDVAFSPPAWSVDRMSAGILMLIIIAILLAVGVTVIALMPDVISWQ
jgi:hypothetical protein